MSIGNAGDVPNLKAIKAGAWEFLLVYVELQRTEKSTADEMLKCGVEIPLLQSSDVKER